MTTQPSAECTPSSPITMGDLLALVTSAATILPRELHVRNRRQLVRLTGAHEESNPNIPPSLPFAGMPVYCDDAMPDGVMEMRDSSTGETLRRWILRPDGQLISVNVQALERFVVQPFTLGGEA